MDQALDLVLKTKGLDKRKLGNVLLVAPADEIAARERQELEAQKQIAELAPLRRELIQVNYAKAADIAKLFQSVTSSGEEKENSRGSITVDDRTNSIIAYQPQERLDELRRIVSQLDIPVRQVMIEARIVEANVGYDKSLGVRWGGAYHNGNWNSYGKNGNMGIKDKEGYNCGPFQGSVRSRPEIILRPHLWIWGPRMLVPVSVLALSPITSFLTCNYRPWRKPGTAKWFRNPRS